MGISLTMSNYGFQIDASSLLSTLPLVVACWDRDHRTSSQKPLRINKSQMAAILKVLHFSIGLSAFKPSTLKESCSGEWLMVETSASRPNITVENLEF